MSAGRPEAPGEADPTGVGGDAVLDAVLAAVGQGVLVIDGGFRVARLNEPCRSLLDLPFDLTEPGVPVRDIVHFCARRGDYGPGDPEELASELLSLFSLREPQSYERGVPGGRSVTARTYPVAGGGVVMTFADETDYRHAVDDLYAANRTLERSIAEHVEDLARVNVALTAATARAEEAAQAKARTLAMMNREMRQPVAGIVEAVRTLLAASLGPEERASLSHILRSVESLRLILDDLGDLTRLEADQIRLEAAPFTLETVVGSVLSGMSERAEAAGVRLTGAVDPALPAVVTGDAAWLRHVLVELVGLGLRDTSGRDGSGRTIAIAAEPALLPDLSAGVRFAVEGLRPETVHDVGLWLDSGDLPAEAAGVRRAGLRSLGLHICHRIVGLMGGDMGVQEAGSDGGPALWFTAGLAEAGDAATPAVSDRLNILVVEDNPVNQRVNAWLLEREGHRVTVVGDGRVAVETAARGGFDAVLMDLDVPGMDGIAATRAIRALDGPVSAVPIIAITNSVMAADVERCRAAGMDDHMPKPVNPAGLVRLLGRLVQGRPVQGWSAAAEPVGDGVDEQVLNALEGVIGRGHVVELVADVLEHLSVLEPRLAAAQAALDLDAVEQIAAELKPIAGTVGLTRVYTLAVGLERLCRDGRRNEALDAAVELGRLLDLGRARLAALWSRV